MRSPIKKEKFREGKTEEKDNEFKLMFPNSGKRKKAGVLHKMEYAPWMQIKVGVRLPETKRGVAVGLSKKIQLGHQLCVVGKRQKHGLRGGPFSGRKRGGGSRVPSVTIEFGRKSNHSVKGSYSTCKEGNKREATKSAILVLEIKEGARPIIWKG